MKLYVKLFADTYPRIAYEVSVLKDIHASIGSIALPEP